ncbi:putative bifunctional diguanylate cyclase/phosphodiesterase [Stutzerimonas tarimensis]|uniref:Bifunctional diguanylate cyclase/phosphodiesterase n=1 Tax=Stutzerimonas tarimensis TaxID=1507735 RepID=A0ABV7T5P3_9GAMM
MLPLFMSDMPADYLSIHSSHGAGLVLLSFLIASTAGFTALAMAHRISVSRSSASRALWRAVGVLSLGGGIWSMHFIAMLALETSLPIRYSPGITGFSLAVAIAASWLLMRLLGRERLSGRQYLGGSLVAGLGIAGMHYIGMAAMRSQAQAFYDPTGVAASVLIAIAASLAALALSMHYRNRPDLHWQRLVCSLAMGAAICSMHFTGMHAMTLAVPADQANLLADHLHQDGEQLAMGVAIGLIALLVLVAGVVASWAEQRFSQQRAMLNEVEQRLDAITHYDPLTNLFNGRAFTEVVGQVLAAHQHLRQGVAVLFIDLDNFKRVNDSLGHRAGDEVLQQVAQRIRAALGIRDVLARFAGDEFCVLALLDTSDHAEQLAERILAHLRPPFSVSGARLQLTASVGISLFPEDGQGFDDLFKHAGLALGQCKASGRNRSLRFDPRQEMRAAEDLSLEQDLRRALNEDQLGIHYQPIIDCHSGEVVSLEALARWQHPRLGAISPERFVQLAEQYGFIAELDSWVTRRACQDLQRLGRPRLRVAVNCSALNLGNPRLPDAIADILADTALAAERLTVEITENALMNNLSAAVAVLESIRALGVKLSIDDFGTGYSSLAYLSRLPVDTLKVDRSFVRDLDSQANDRAIAAAIIAMAHKLDLKVIAEGVEQPTQQTFLTGNGCDMIQGYLFSRPLPLDGLTDWLAQRAALNVLDPQATATA